jgi:hypothetical protein
MEDVGVDHRGAHVRVAEQILDRADVVAVLEEVGGERVTQSVATNLLGDSRAQSGVAHRALEHGLVKVMAAAALTGAATVNVEKARFWEDRMYEARWKSGEIRPNDEKRDLEYERSDTPEAKPLQRFVPQTTKRKAAGTICAKHPEGRFPANGS